MRSFYRFVIKLHPADFRERFGDEMLCIFDEAGTGWSAAFFLGDGCLSLARQWLTRAQVWKWAAAMFGGVISLVAGFGSFLPWQAMWTAFRGAF
jgi:hypothetical protein